MADIEDVAKLADVLQGHDTVVRAVHFSASDPAKLIAAVERSGVRRYLVVGGAGNLEVAPGVRFNETREDARSEIVRDYLADHNECPG